MRGSITFQTENNSAIGLCYANISYGKTMFWWKQTRKLRPQVTKRTRKAHKATLLQKSSLSVPPDSFKRVSVHLTTSYESRNSTAIVTHGGMIGDVIICIFVIRFDVLSVIFFRIRDSDSSVLPMEQLLC